MSGSVDTEYWFTGNMIESRELYPNFSVREGKYEENKGRDVCLVPEVRHLPSARKEKQFTAFYTTKEKVDGEMVEDILTRAEHYKDKGWLPLNECTEEIQDMIKKMHKYNKKNAEEYVAGKEKYEPGK